MGVYNDESKTNNPNEEFIKKFEIEEMEDSEESSSQSGDRNNSSPYQIQADPQNREKPNNDDDANSPLENHFRRNALNQRSKLFRKASDGFKVTVDLMVKRCESNNPLKQYLNNIEPKEIHKRTSSMVDGPLNELPGGPQRNYKVNSIIDSRQSVMTNDGKLTNHLTNNNTNVVSNTADGYSDESQLDFDNEGSSGQINLSGLDVNAGRPMNMIKQSTTTCDPVRPIARDVVHGNRVGICLQSLDINQIRKYRSNRSGFDNNEKKLASFDKNEKISLDLSRKNSNDMSLLAKQISGLEPITQNLGVPKMLIPKKVDKTEKQMMRNQVKADEQHQQEFKEKIKCDVISEESDLSLEKAHSKSNKSELEDQPQKNQNPSVRFHINFSRSSSQPFISKLEPSYKNISATPAIHDQFFNQYFYSPSTMMAHNNIEKSRELLNDAQHIAKKYLSKSNRKSQYFTSKATDYNLQSYVFPKAPKMSQKLHNVIDAMPQSSYEINRCTIENASSKNAKLRTVHNRSSSFAEPLVAQELNDKKLVRKQTDKDSMTFEYEKYKSTKNILMNGNKDADESDKGPIYKKSIMNKSINLFMSKNNSNAGISPSIILPGDLQKQPGNEIINEMDTYLAELTKSDLGGGNPNNENVQKITQSQRQSLKKVEGTPKNEKASAKYLLNSTLNNPSKKNIMSAKMINTSLSGSTWTYNIETNPLLSTKHVRSNTSLLGISPNNLTSPQQKQRQISDNFQAPKNMTPKSKLDEGLFQSSPAKSNKKIELPKMSKNQLNKSKFNNTLMEDTTGSFNAYLSLSPTYKSNMLKKKPTIFYDTRKPNKNKLRPEENVEMGMQFPEPQNDQKIPVIVSEGIKKNMIKSQMGLLEKRGLNTSIRFMQGRQSIDGFYSSVYNS